MEFSEGMIFSIVRIPDTIIWSSSDSTYLSFNWRPVSMNTSVSVRQKTRNFIGYVFRHHSQFRLFISVISSRIYEQFLQLYSSELPKNFFYYYTRVDITLVHRYKKQYIMTTVLRNLSIPKSISLINPRYILTVGFNFTCFSCNYLLCWFSCYLNMSVDMIQGN